MNTKNIVSSIVISVIVVILGFSIFGGKIETKTVVEKQLGAVTGPDATFPCETHNGVRRCFNRIVARQSTTTPCAIKSPEATSTLIYGAGAKFTTGTSSATRISLAKATTAFATTTSLGLIDVAAGAQGTFLASTTPNGAAALTIADQAWVFAPNTFFVVGVAGAITSGDTAGTGYVPVGTCNATWEVN